MADSKREESNDTPPVSDSPGPSSKISATVPSLKRVADITLAKSISEEEPTAIKKPKNQTDGEAEMESNLQCSICMEIIYDCISLQPCMHSFCAGCYSDWMPKSDACPQCRNKVDAIRKNHMINNIIDAYLKDHPGKKIFLLIKFIFFINFFLFAKNFLVFF